jgi:hypothetical protein
MIDIPINVFIGIGAGGCGGLSLIHEFDIQTVEQADGFVAAEFGLADIVIEYIDIVIAGIDEISASEIGFRK